MKKVLLFAGLFTLLIASCGKEAEIAVDNSAGNVADNTVTDLVVRAVIGDGRDTKTVVVPDGDIQTGGADVYWTSGDAINLFYGSTSSGKFTTSITEASAEAIFYGSVGVATGTIESGAEAKSFWGVYPYSPANTCDGSGVTLKIPSNQSGVAGTFANNLNPTVATSTGLDLAFYNVGCWFIFSVTRDDIASVALRGNNSETLAGTVRVEMDGFSRPKVKSVTNGRTSITITPSVGDCFIPGKYYYMVLIPQTLSNGYSLTMTTNNDLSATYTQPNSKTLARSSVNGKLDADLGLTFIQVEDIHPQYECVDLGLSVKWATHNIGATKPEEYGDYFAWGETEPKTTTYDWSTYRWCNGSFTTLTKYCTNSSYGTADNKTALDPEDDVAHVEWGGKWRMPTKEDFNALITNCTWTWCASENIEFNGVAGYKVTSNMSGFEDRFIFLPAAGWHGESGLSKASENGDYWSSSLSTFAPSGASFLQFQSGDQSMYEANRCYGFAVRPVCPKD